MVIHKALATFAFHLYHH